MAELLETQILDYFRFIWKEADEYFMAYVKPEWDANKALYEDSYEFKKKFAWQARYKDPIADNLVSRLANFLTRVLVTVPDDDFFEVKAKDETKRIGYKELALQVMKANKFPLIFRESLQKGLISSLVVNKVEYLLEDITFPVWNAKSRDFSIEKKVIGRTHIKHVNPWMIRLDPKGDSYIIEIEEIDLPAFLERAKVNNWVNVDNVVMNTLNPALGGVYEENAPPSNFRPKITLHHVYTKAITDNQGNILARDYSFIVANMKNVVQFKRNLLPRGKFPYVVGHVIKSAFGRYRRAYLSKLRSIIKGYLDSLNLVIDGFRLSMLGIFEYDISGISTDTAHQFTAVLEPGKFYPVTTPNTIRHIFNPQFPAIGLQDVFLKDRIIQNRSLQTEFFQGAPTAKGRPTATEIGTKTRESTQFITDIANEQENEYIEPIIELILDTEAIYLNEPNHIDVVENSSEFAKPAVSRIIQMDFSERIRDVLDLRVSAKGISGKIQKGIDLNKIIQVLTILGNIQGIGQTIDIPKLVSSILATVDLPVSSIFDESKLESLGRGLSESIGGFPTNSPTPAENK